MAIYISFPDVEGPCKAADHEGWIEMLSFDWGISRETSGGNQPGMVSGVPRLDGFNFTADIGSASSTLQAKMITGEHFPEVVIECIKIVGGSTPTKEVWYKVTLSNVLVTSLSQGLTSDTANDNVTLTFRKHLMEIKDLLEDGTVTAVVESEYDFSSQT